MASFTFDQSLAFDLQIYKGKIKTSIAKLSKERYFEYLRFEDINARKKRKETEKE